MTHTKSTKMQPDGGLRRDAIHAAEKEIEDRRTRARARGRSCYARGPSQKMSKLQCLSGFRNQDHRLMT